MQSIKKIKVTENLDKNLTWQKYYGQIGNKYAYWGSLAVICLFPFSLILDVKHLSAHQELYLFRLMPSVLVGGFLFFYAKFKLNHQILLSFVAIVTFIGGAYRANCESSATYLLLNTCILLAGGFFSILPPKTLLQNFIIYLFIQILFYGIACPNFVHLFQDLHSFVLLIFAAAIFAVSGLRYEMLKKYFSQKALLEEVKNELSFKEKQYSKVEEDMLKINEEIMIQNEVLKQQKDEIITQKDEIERQRNELESKNQQIIGSINYAKRIQEAILPHQDDFSEKFKDFFIYYKPRDIVSGDFLWLQQKDNLIWLALADCTGHGVPGALMTMLGSVMLNNILLTKNAIKPNQILYELNKQISLTLRQNDKNSINKDGMDITLCLIDTKSQKVEIAQAHHSVVYFQENKMYLLKGSVNGIGGWQDEKEYESNSISTNVTTTFYLFSDGFQDQFGGINKRKYSSKKLYKFLEENQHYSMQEQKELLEKEWQEWIALGQENQIDDVTILGFRL